MYGAVKDELAATLTEIEEAGLYKRERELTTPQSSHVATTGGEALNFCANNYLGLRRPPRRRRARAGRRSTSGASGWRRCASSAARRPSTPRSRRGCREFLGTEATILYSSCFDANGGVFEVLFGAEDAIVSRRAQPRLDHRRHPAEQGGAVPLQERRHGRPAGPARGGPGRRGAAHRASSPTGSSRWTAPTPRSTRSATSPTSSRRWSSSTTRTPWASSATVAAARPSSSASWTASTSSPARSARRSAARRAATSRATRRSSTCCASARAPTCSPTRSHRPSWPGRWPRSTSCRGRARRARRCAPTPRSSAS